MHVSVVEGNRGLSQDIKKQGELTRGAFRRTMGTASELLGLLPSGIYNVINVTY